MNALFAIAQGLASIVPVWLLYLIIPKSLMVRLPPEIQYYAKPGVITLSALLFVIVTVNALMSYGPRVELERTALPLPADAVEIETGKLFTPESDRVGQFDERIEQ